MTEAPLVTVVIPTWNRAQLLQEAVDSVVNQSYQNWELFVIDDGSTDDTAQRLKARERHDIHVIESEHIGHLGRLRNLGAAAGHGELLAFLDSDDLWHPQKLEKQVQAIGQSAAGWSYTEYALFDETGAEIPMRAGRAPALSGRIVRALLNEETGVCSCTLLVRRSLYASLGGFSEDPRLRYRDDLDLPLRLACASEVVALPEKLTRIREHADRMTRDLPHPHEHTACVYESFLAYAPDEELAALARRRWARSLAEAGAWRLASGEFGAAASLLYRAFTVSNRRRESFRALARGITGYFRHLIGG